MSSSFKRPSETDFQSDYFGFYKKPVSFSAHTRMSPRYLADFEAALVPLLVFVSGLGAYSLYFTFSRSTSGPISFCLGTSSLVALISYFFFDAYKIHDARSVVDGMINVRKILLAITVSFLTVICFLYMAKISAQLSRGWMATWFILTVSAILTARVGLSSWARTLRSQNRLFENIAILGQREMAENVGAQLKGSASSIGDVRIFAASPDGDSAEPSMQRALDDLVDYARTGACERIILAFPKDDIAISQSLDRLDALPVDVQLCPDAMKFALPIRSVRMERNLLILDLQEKPFSERGTLAKNAFDYFAASFAFVFLAPLMAVIALLIKIDSKGPVLFVQDRHGYNNKVIRVFKFRTMRASSDDVLVRQATRGDPRVTRVGRWLRKSSLDELPQLLNVLRGELSLVGPRPHALSHNEAFAASLNSYFSRHKVKPGITGWAQINGFRGEVINHDAIRKRLDCDLFYIKNWSIWLDLYILVKTLKVPFAGKNAY